MGELDIPSNLDNPANHPPVDKPGPAPGSGQPNSSLSLSALHALGAASNTDQFLAAVRADQRTRWLRADRRTAEAYLAQFPPLRQAGELALVLIYGEFLLRQDLGEEPALDEYVQRFPEHAERLRQQHALHRLMASQEVSATQGTQVFRMRNSEPSAEASVASEPSWPTLPGYQILGELGRGGMAVVYQARQLALQRLVALKMTLAVVSVEPEQQHRFQAEAEAIGRLRHPNIVQVHDYGLHEGRPYLALEFVEGGTLAGKAAGVPQPPSLAAQFVETLAAAMHHAHGLGLIHRDLKPANVLITSEGVLKITDFGLAKQLEDKATQTASGALLGTPSYMAPEQVASTWAAIGPATDVYALGVILYELLTGRLPFLGDNVLDVLRKVQEQEPIPPHRLQPGTPRDLETICLKCLQKEPAKRYATAAALAEDLRCFQAGKPIAARPVGGLERTWRWCRRNPGWAAMLATVASLLLVVALGASLLSLRLGAALGRAHDAEQDSQRKLFESQLSQADAIRQSRRSGQRFEALALLDRADELGCGLNLPREKFDALRDTTLAALVMPDLYPGKTWDGYPAGSELVDFDDRLEIYARTDTQGNCSIRRVEGDTEIHFLRAANQVDGSSWTFLSPDGRFIAVRQADTRLHLWRLDRSQPEQVLEEMKVFWVAFHPRRPEVAFSHDGGAISHYDLATGQQLHRLPPDGLTREMVIALHPTEPLVAVGSYYSKVAQVRDLRTWELVQSLSMKWNAFHVAWHPRGHTLAVSDGESIHLFDRAAFQRQHSFETTSGGSRLFFNHTGDRLAVYSWDSQLRLFEVPSGRLLFQIPYASTSFALHFDPDGRRLAGFVRGNRLGIWDVADGREYRTLLRQPLPKEVVYLNADISPDGRLLAVAMTDGVGFWDLEAGTLIDFLKVENPRSALFEPFSARSLLVADESGTYRWPLASDPKTPDLVRVGPPQSLALPGGQFPAQSADGRVLGVNCRAVGNFEPWAGVWILHADQPGRPLHLEPGKDIWSFTLSPNGRHAVTVENIDGVAKLWDARTGRLERTLLAHGGPPHFSPDGQWLALGGEGGRLFRVGTWEEGIMLGNRGRFAPDSKMLVVWTGSAAIRLVETTTGRPLARLEDPNLESPDQVLFSPDGTRLITVHLLTGIHVWDLRRLRAELALRGRDWDARPLDPAPAPAEPLRLKLDRGDYDQLRERQLQENFDRAVQAAEHLPNRWSLRGLFHQRAGRYPEAIRDLREVLKLRPDYPKGCNELARLYATAPEQFRNPADAVSLAERAVALRPGEWTFHNTLGIAYYRAGRFRDAIKALEKSLKGGAGESDAFDLYFLALCHHRLGDPGQSRECFQRGVLWHENQGTRLDEDDKRELRKFRAEAEALLGPP